MRMGWHQQEANEVIKKLGSTIKGLTTDEAHKRLEYIPCIWDVNRSVGTQLTERAHDYS